MAPVTKTRSGDNQAVRAAAFCESGLAALRRGANSLARARLARAVELDPTSDQAWIGLARAAASPFDAMESLKQAQRISPDSDLVRAGLIWHGWVTDTGVIDDAAAVARPVDLAHVPETEDRQLEDVTEVVPTVVANEVGPAVEAAPAEEVVIKETAPVVVTEVVAPVVPAEQLSSVTSSGAESEEPRPVSTGADVAGIAATVPKESSIDFQLVRQVAEPAVEMVVVPAESRSVVALAPPVPVADPVLIEPVVAAVDVASVATSNLEPTTVPPQVAETTPAADPAAVEWTRWLTPPTQTANPVADGNKIVNEVSERLAHALQRVLGGRAKVADATSGPTDSPSAGPVETENASTGSTLLEVVSSNPEVPTLDAPAPEGRNEIVVLVVDDSPTIRHVVADALRPHGFRVCEAADGIQGIREIATVRPDLILMDITMPRLDGYRLCRLVKGHANTRGIPVIMLSGKDGTFDRLRGRLAGCSDYISKPFSNADLLDKVRRHLGEKAVARSR